MATVANHHLARQTCTDCTHMAACQTVSVTMEQVSEYYSGLSAQSKQRYTNKVTEVGVRKDPYAIPSEL